VLGGALLPAVLVFGVFALMFWVHFDGRSATGRRLLDHENVNQQYSGATDQKATQHLQTATAMDDLSRRADELVAASCVFGAVLSTSGLGIACMLWRRVNRLESVVQV